MASNEASGYDLHWVEDPPDDLKCLICLCVPRDPQQHPGDAKNQCGKIFCLECITEYQRSKTTCPNCRQNLTLFPDSRSARAIKALKVKCDHLTNGCDWTGELGSLETHRSKCSYESVSCKYAAVGCEEKPLRKDLTKHEENDQLHLRITRDKVLALTKVNSHLLNSILCTLKLINYHEHKNDSKEFNSAPFYTSYSGYKMCLLVFANGKGAGAGTHISVYACLMKGDHDDTLTWPFTGRVKIELLNQLEDKNHHKRTLTFPADNESSQRKMDNYSVGSGYGIVNFISHTFLDYNASANTQYLKNDTLVFRVSVEIPDHKPWLECTVYNK